MLDPTTVDLTALPWLPLEDKSAFPARACIYFAIDSLGVVQYVGRSLNARQRWSNHHKFEALSDVGGVKIAYLFVDAPELLPEIEKALIKHFQPPLNVVGLGRTPTHCPVVSKELTITSDDENFTEIEPITRYHSDAVAIRIFIKESERKVLKDVCETEGTNMSHLARALLLQWLKSKEK